MFKRKYAHPNSYWRQYAPWWAQWKGQFAHLQV